MGSGSPTLYTPRTELVMQALCGLGFSTAFEQEGGGPFLTTGCEIAPLRIYGLPPKPDPVLNYHQNRESGSRKEDTSGFPNN